MLKKLRLLALVVLFLVIAVRVRAETTPEEISFCDLAKHPKPMDGKTIRVRGTVSAEFESFTLWTKGCETQQAIWLAFGGDVPGIVASTANDNSRKPGVDIQINGVSYGIKKDENFRTLYALLAARHGEKAAYRVTATLTGAFIAGQETKTAGGQNIFMGFGHLGCCSLLVITEVSGVESVPPGDLDVRGTVLGPDGKPMKGFTVINEVNGGTPRERQQTATDSVGKFAFSEAGQLLRFEDPNYRPLALYVESGKGAVHVRLEEAKRSDWVVPTCDQVKDIGSRIGFYARFALPDGWESSLTDEEGLHAYFIYPRGRSAAEAELILSTNPEQEEAVEPDNFADSKWSAQRWIKDSAGKVIGIDTRAELKNGRLWRAAVLLRHDSIGYTVRSGSSASVMDKMIESACIAK